MLDGRLAFLLQLLVPHHRRMFLQVHWVLDPGRSESTPYFALGAVIMKL